MFALPFNRREPPALPGARVILRPPTRRDFQEWAELRRESRAFLEPWEPRWSRDELEPAAWRQRLRRYREERNSGSAVTFFIFERESGRMVGGLSIGNIRQGVSQSGQIGYWIGEKFAGQGFMLDALKTVIPFAFEALRLHRIEAACIPDNKRSVRVLEKAGFTREGLLRSYLKINGVWRDHVLYALIAGDDRRDTKRG